MINEVPLRRDMLVKKIAQAIHNAIVLILQARFASVPEEVEAGLSVVRGEDRLLSLVKLAMRCGDLEAFRVGLVSAILAKDERQPKRRSRSRR